MDACLKMLYSRDTQWGYVVGYKNLAYLSEVYSANFNSVAVEMSKETVLGGISILNYVDENVSVKVVKLIQSYTGVVNKMVWRKY